MASKQAVPDWSAIRDSVEVPKKCRALEGRARGRRAVAGVSAPHVPAAPPESDGANR